MLVTTVPAGLISSAYRAYGTAVKGITKVPSKTPSNVTSVSTRALAHWMLFHASSVWSGPISNEIRPLTLVWTFSCVSE